MNISKFFVDRPIFAAVLSLLIFIAGLLAMFQLPVSEYPNVAPPSVVVTASFPGANPKVTAETVARPLEEQINGNTNHFEIALQHPRRAAPRSRSDRMGSPVRFKIALPATL